MKNPSTHFEDHCDLHISAFPEGMEADIETRGAKNAALPMIMYSFILDECDVTIENVPNIADVQSTLDLLEAMGGQFTFNREKGDLHITHGITCNRIPDDLVHKTRISVLLMSVLLAKYGTVLFPTEVGGCNFGARKFDYHLEAFRSLGCSVSETGRHISIVRKDENPIQPLVTFPQPTTTGTANAMFLAAHCGSTTKIENAHLRTEILELISFLNQCGNNIAIEGDTIVIHGAEARRTKNIIKTVRDDVEEALTYIALGYLTDSKLKVKFSNPYNFGEVNFLKEIAADTFHRENYHLTQSPISEEQRHDMVSMETGPYPKIGSDSQPILSALLLQMARKFRVIDNRFTDRFSYLDHFRAYNISVTKVGNRIDVVSPEGRIIGSEVHELEAQNLRCAINALLTASYFQQPIVIRNAHFMQRGYTDIFERMNTLGFKTSILT